MCLKKSPKILLICQYPRTYLTHPTGIEPTHMAPEAIALSTELRVLINNTLIFSTVQGAITKNLRKFKNLNNKNVVIHFFDHHKKFYIFYKFHIIYLNVFQAPPQPFQVL